MDASPQESHAVRIKDDDRGRQGIWRPVCLWDETEGGSAVFLLTTVGRKSGEPRTVSLSHMTDEEGIPITVGTYGGLPTEPAWVLNLRDNSDAVMQVRDQKTPVRAEFLEGDEWASTWERIVDRYPLYEDPLSTANRDIPIIRLTATPLS